MNQINSQAEAYQRLFLNEAGGLKPEARLVLEDLLRFARFFKDAATAEAQTLAVLEGARQTVRHILKQSGGGGEFMKRLLEGDKNG